MTKKGIITFADPEYIGQAKLLALSAKKFSNLPTTLVTTKPITAEEFEGIVMVPEPFAERGMITAIQASPYNQTAFMYADTLVLSDINVHFDMLDHHDLVFTKPVDYKSQRLSSDLYENRKLITKNDLPDVWANYFLYNKTQELSDMCGLLYLVSDHWKEIKDQACPAYSNDEDMHLLYNTMLSAALKLKKQDPLDYGITFTNMSKQTNNTNIPDLAFKDWYTLLSFWATDDKHIKVGDYNQTGIWHYSNSFYTPEFDTAIRKLCSN
jgi:hypothetical protein